MDLHDYLTYQDGMLYWKVSINRRHAKQGDRAGTLRKDKYRTVTLFNKKYLEHRLIYFLQHNEWPLCIDHINRDKTDNRAENLRSVEHRVNSLNHDGNSPTPNICLHGGRYQLTIKGKYIGRYDTLELANIKRDEVLNQK